MFLFMLALALARMLLLLWRLCTELNKIEISFKLKLKMVAKEGTYWMSKCSNSFYCSTHFLSFSLSLRHPINDIQLNEVSGKKCWNFFFNRFYTILPSHSRHRHSTRTSVPRFLCQKVFPCSFIVCHSRL